MIRSSPWENSSCGGYLRLYLTRMVQGCEDTLEHMLGICGEPDGPYMYAPVLEQEREMLHSLLERFTLSAGAVSGEDRIMSRMARELSDISFGKLPGT